MTVKLPAAPSAIAKSHPDIWKAYGELGAACAAAGPLDARTRRLVKLALAVGAGTEGAVHSHARRGLDEGLSAAELEQVALLGITTLGLARAVAAHTWIGDITSD
jgi:alkylhydroperoxidase/carboxymuconolactone decarboxylase family protein YurZ